MDKAGDFVEGQSTVSAPMVLGASTIQDSDRLHAWFGVACVTLVYAALIYLTKPISWGDTPVYAWQVIWFSKGLLDPRMFWEFGHLFWRPIGYWVWHLGMPYWSRQFDGNQVLQVYAALRLPNLVLGYVAALASFGIGLKVSRSVVVGTLITVAFLGWNPFINYFQSGTSYVPGLAMQLAAVYLLLEDSNGKKYRRRAWAAGALLAFSVCLWIPYLFSIPGIFLLAYLKGAANPSSSGSESRAKQRTLLHALGVCALVGIVGFGLGTYWAGIRSPGEFKTWAADAGHGFHPDKRYFRVATGLPRGLVEIGQDGVTLKRFVLRDPYNPVRVSDLIRTSWWKLLLFYGGIAGLIWMLMGNKSARWVAWPFFLTSGLLLILGVFLFETGQSERWMPGFTVLVPALGIIFRSPKPIRLATVPVVLLLAVAWGNNLAAHASPREADLQNVTVARVLDLKPALVPGSVVCLLSIQDDVNVFLGRFPFHPLSSLFENGTIRLYFVTDPGNSSSVHWRQSFTTRSLQVWQANGDIWISKRMVAERPLPEWGWVEGDDQHLRWKDISAFFKQYTFDGDVGGTDGFLRIARIPGNQSLLESAAPQRATNH